MRFLDANIFIYACYKPKRTLTQKEEAITEESKNNRPNKNTERENAAYALFDLTKKSI